MGKTACSIALSQALNGKIVSADSRQIYQEMSIGTAKPSTQEIAAGPIVLVDHVSVTEAYSAGRYEQEALAQISDAYANGQLPILSGGTGLYVKAVCDGLDIIPKVDKSISQDIEDKLKSGERKVLLEELAAADPAIYKSMDTANDRRIIRFLGVVRQSGQPYSSFLNQPKKAREFTPIFIKLERPREELYDRINKRVLQMIESGLVDEVRGLVPYKAWRALDTVGYKEVFSFLDGTLDEGQMISEIQQNSRRYAKRQMTWNRNQVKAQPFYPEDIKGILSYLRESIKQG